MGLLLVLVAREVGAVVLLCQAVPEEVEEVPLAVADKGSAGTDSAADKGSAADTDSAAVEVGPPPL
jgi:hypothetical protein